MTTTFDHGYALLIGVGTTQDRRFSPLPTTVQDVKALQAILTDPSHCGYPNSGNHQRLLAEGAATRKGILEGLNWLAQRAAHDPNATVLIYYSGHGGRPVGGNEGDYFLIPNDTDHNNIGATAIFHQEWVEAIRKIRAKRLVVMIDSCHAGGIGPLTKDGSDTLNLVAAPPPEGLAKSWEQQMTLGQGEGCAVFSASKPHQSSYILRDGTLSLFTHHLLEAFRGEASTPTDRTVTIATVMKHLGQTVAQRAHQEGFPPQEPLFEFVGEDFPVALARGGKGAVSSDLGQTGIESSRFGQTKVASFPHVMPIVALVLATLLLGLFLLLKFGGDQIHINARGNATTPVQQGDGNTQTINIQPGEASP